VVCYLKDPYVLSERHLIRCVCLMVGGNMGVGMRGRKDGCYMSGRLAGRLLVMKMSDGQLCECTIRSLHKTMLHMSSNSKGHT